MRCGFSSIPDAARCRAAAIEALAPVQILGPEVGIVEWRFLQTDVSHLTEGEIKRGGIAVGVSMLEFPDQGADALVHEIPCAIDPGNAAGASAVCRRLGGIQKDTGVVPTER